MDFRRKYGPWALIAGASEGTGAAFARQLAEKGLNLILVARREGPLAALADRLRADHGVECVTASVDLGANDATARMVDAVAGREVGLFVSNAGADPNASQFLDRDIEAWDALAMRNVMTVMRSVHHFARAMRERQRGGIILVGSGACYGGLPGIAAYSATKAFDLMLGEGLWAELRPHGVDVLGLIMNRTDTPAHRELMERIGMPVPDDLASAEDVAALGLERLPHGPVANWGQADDEERFGGSAASRRDRIVKTSERAMSYLKGNPA